VSSPLLYPFFRGYLASGAPNAGGSVSTFVAGTSTPLNTYADAGLVTANANPTVLDANGEAVMYCGPFAYKIIEKDSLGATLRTFDNYSPNQAVASPTISQWVPVLTVAQLAPAFGFTSTVQFTVNAGYDLIGTLGVTAGDRIRTQNTAGLVYSTITAISFGAGINTVTVTNDGASVIDAGISAIAIGFNRYVNPAYLDPRSALLVTKNGNQTGFAAGVKVTGWNVVNDPLSEWSAVNNQWTAKYSGAYLVICSLEISNTVANIGHTLVVGSQTTIAPSPPTAAQHTTIVASRLHVCVAGTTIVAATLTGDANTTVYATDSNLSIIRLP
jgi:hypothetical protein